MAKLSPIIQISADPYTKFIKCGFKDKKKRDCVVYYDSLSLYFHQQSVLKHLDRQDIEQMLNVPDVPKRSSSISDDNLLEVSQSRRLQNPADIQHQMMHSANNAKTFRDETNARVEKERLEKERLEAEYKKVVASKETKPKE